MKLNVETCKNLRSNSLVYVKFLIRIGLTWELRAESSYTVEACSGICVGWDDDIQLVRLQRLQVK